MNLKALSSETFNQFADECGLAFIVLFGSAAKNTLKEKSDIDVAFFSKKEIIGDPYFKLYEVISEKIGEQRTVDLVDLKKANSLLRYEIVRNGILLYGDPAGFSQYKTFAFKDYVDSKSLLELEALLITKKQQLLANFNRGL